VGDTKHPGAGALNAGTNSLTETRRYVEAMQVAGEAPEQVSDELSEYVQDRKHNSK
jgi:HAMP domain-containing protein